MINVHLLTYCWVVSSPSQFGFAKCYLPMQLNSSSGFIRAGPNKSISIMPTKFNPCVNVTWAKHITALENLVFCRLLQYPQKDFLKSVEDICWNILSCRHVRSWEYRVVILEWCAKSKSNWAPLERKHRVIISVSHFLSFIESTLPSWISSFHS